MGCSRVTIHIYIYVYIYIFNFFLYVFIYRFNFTSRGRNNGKKNRDEQYSKRSVQNGSTEVHGVDFVCGK